MYPFDEVIQKKVMGQYGPVRKSYLKDMSAAWEVVEHLTRLGYKIVITSNPGTKDYFCEISRPGYIRRGPNGCNLGSEVQRSSSASSAICLAAHNAVVASHWEPIEKINIKEDALKGNRLFDLTQAIEVLAQDNDQLDEANDCLAFFVPKTVPGKTARIVVEDTKN